MNNITNLTNRTCTSCQICYAVCPKAAITIRCNNGFYFPFVDETLCNNCGICTKNCYKSGEPLNIVVMPETFSAKLKNRKLLRKVSSGGVLRALCDKAFELGYGVYGAYYNISSGITLHRRAKNKDDIASFSGSKYMQSYTADALKEIVLNKGKILFVGTPCQVYAVDKLLKNVGERGQAILVDFYCHGVPNKHLWDVYVGQIEKKTGKIREIEFRTKDFSWHNYGNKIIGEHAVYNKKNDIFYKLFFSDMILNASCYTCGCTKSFGYSDIRVGDFWGDRYGNDTEGVSAVCINTMKGREAFDLIKDQFDISKVQMNEIEKFQSVESRNYNMELSQKMLDCIKSGNLKRADRIYLASLGLKAKYIILLKRFINNFPLALVSRIKKIFNSVNK